MHSNHAKKSSPHPKLSDVESSKKPAVAGSPPASPTDSTDIVLPRAISMERLSTQISEHSPLLSPTHPGTGRGSLQLNGNLLSGDTQNEPEQEESMSTLYLVLLTLGMAGLQISWTVELSNGTPYLLSLGISKSLMALVWIAGPLSGTLVQPYVGIRSDNCRVSWGKRKPFMLGGAIATIISLMALAWAREIVRGSFSIFGYGPESEAVHLNTIIFAVVLVYVLDFAINTVQAAIRAFIVDCAPTHQQEAANAWAGRIVGVGNILGYLSGYLHLPRLLPFLGDTQFKVLCALASIALASTLSISCLSIKERDPRLEGPMKKTKTGVLAFFKQVLKSIRRLPPQIRMVCEVQFFAWIGWFPFLFYITTYIGQLYANPFFEENPNMTNDEINEVMEHATRIGTFSLLIFAITSFSSNIILPMIVAPSRATEDLSASSTLSLDSKPLSSTNSSWKKDLCSHFVIPGFTLARAWQFSHVLYAFVMFLTFFVRTPAGGTVLVGITGVSWALTLWAPFALISAEISERDALRRSQQQQAQTYQHQRQHHRSSSSLLRDATSAVANNDSDQAGIILGLHNVSIAAPQVIATLGSSVIFRWLQKPRGTPDDDSVGWVLRIAALASLVAAWRTGYLSDETKPSTKDAAAVDADVERGNSRS
ncbi:MAG: hypothetical protein M1816_003257 [Peltula sp. TS41687]|nr:MAG: hypothetical protein M1816_003257 [Peltula sp. TS41687]